LSAHLDLVTPAAHHVQHVVDTGTAIAGAIALRDLWPKRVVATVVGASCERRLPTLPSLTDSIAELGWVFGVSNQPAAVGMQGKGFVGSTTLTPVASSLRADQCRCGQGRQRLQPVANLGLQLNPTPRHITDGIPTIGYSYPTSSTAMVVCAAAPQAALARCRRGPPHPVPATSG
jgi:hypothetical protein